MKSNRLALATFLLLALSSLFGGITALRYSSRLDALEKRLDALEVRQ